MPMLSDPDHRFDEEARTPAKPVTPPPFKRWETTDSIRTELCDGFLPDDGPIENLSSLANPKFQDQQHPESNSRQDLIKRIKLGQSPTWAPKTKHDGPFESKHDGITQPHRQTCDYGTLLPAFEPEPTILQAREIDLGSPSRTNAQLGIDIERPRSALHAGDFTERGDFPRNFPAAFHEDLERICRSEKKTPPRNSPDTEWYKPLPSPYPEASSSQGSPSIDIPDPAIRRPTRSRAPSLQTYPSSFVLQPPTSPLVHQSNNEDLDFTPIDVSTSPSKSSRRHTLPSHGFRSFRTQPTTLAQAARQPPPMQRENTAHYQAHQVRRSLTTSLPFASSSSPRTPLNWRSRRPSLASDASPIQHASMVGSYEESILRGRMSTTPSKPLEFTAQIGALGRGDCKPKYPAHVSVDFPAVYYSWTLVESSSALNEPSPYVGLIDLEHKLAVPPARYKRRQRKGRVRLDDQEGLNEASSGMIRGSRREEKRKRRSPSPGNNLMTGGCYRIPQQGQLQIIIKNPHKTAVKLFLVPYDLKDMEPGTKTFVRQRCYSAGPIIEKALTSRSIFEPGLERPASSSESKSRPTLRYLIQLNICCPSRGRFYLYKNIHVVFANRVPDNKESLQNEIMWPEPRYSTWKPSASTDNIAISATATDKMMRSRSDGESRYHSNTLDAMDALEGFIDVSDSRTRDEPIVLLPGAPLQAVLNEDMQYGRALATRQLPLQLDGQKENGSPGDCTGQTQISPRNMYIKLNRGEVGYGGIFGRPGTPEPGEGLLARRLRGLDVEKGAGFKE